MCRQINKILKGNIIYYNENACTDGPHMWLHSEHWEDLKKVGTMQSLFHMLLVP